MTDKNNNIQSLKMNRLQGRFMRVNAVTSKNREILLVYDVPMNIEMITPMANSLAKFGNVTVPDLPGIGGMNSFYTIKQKPTTENYARYLASFIKLRYQRRRVTIVGIGFGFTIIAQLIKQHPSIAKRIDLAVSIDGFLHSIDLNIEPSQKQFVKLKRLLQSTRIACAVASVTSFQTGIIANTIFSRDIKVNNEYRQHAIAAWQQVDIRTYRTIQKQLTDLDLLKSNTTIPVTHVYISGSYWNLDADITTEHMKIFSTKANTIRIPQDKRFHSTLQKSSHFTKLIPKTLKDQLS